MITNEIYFFENQSSVSTSDSLYNVNDGTLILQVDGNVSNLELLVLGNTDLIDDDFVALKTINATDYSMSDKITSTGIYWIDINGIRKIKLNLSKITGSVNVKALTKRGLTTDLVARAMAANASGGSSYTLPVASADTLGGIKIGENLTIDENGVVSASSGNVTSFYTCDTIGFDGTSPENIYDGTSLKNAEKIIQDAYEKGYARIGILFNGDSSIYSSGITDTSQQYDNYIFYGYKILDGLSAIVDFVQTFIRGTWENDIFTCTNINNKWRGYGTLAFTSSVLTKTNTSSYTPTGDYNPATKKYVDDAITTAITTSLEGSY